MSSKDYELIAEAVRRARQDNDADYHRVCVDTVVVHLCRSLADDNPRFDRTIFVRACGGIEND